MTHDNPYAAAIATAAAHSDMRKADNSEPAPGPSREKPGTQPEPDLSQMTSGQRSQHHARKIAEAYHKGGKPLADAYQQRYPEAARAWVKPDIRVGFAKPAGYCNAVGSLVGGWLSEPGALAGTHRDDVATLNAELGGYKRPANDLSRPMNGATRKRCEAVFTARGFTLPAQANTLSKVKVAAFAALAGALPQGKPFGTIGTIADGVLAIGGATFPIAEHHDQDCLRLTVNGKQVRLRLDLLTAFLEQAGLLHGQPGDLPVDNTEGIGRISPEAETGASQATPKGDFPDIQSRLDNGQSAVPGYSVPAVDPLEMSATELAAESEYTP